MWFAGAISTVQVMFYVSIVIKKISDSLFLTLMSSYFYYIYIIEGWGAMQAKVHM